MRCECVRVKHTRVTQVSTVPLGLGSTGVRVHIMNSLQTSSSLSHHPQGGRGILVCVTMETGDPSVARGNRNHMVNTSEDHMIPWKPGL